MSPLEVAPTNAQQTLDMRSDADRLTAALLDHPSDYLVVVTGAGISLASGIPTFRGNDPDAVWKKDVIELGTYRFFQQDPAGSWQWYCSRFDQVLDKQPNEAHFALVDLERWHTARGGEFLLVSQNVDPLHERAGSERLVKVHGSAERVRCSRYGCEHGAPSGSLARAEVDMQAFQREPILANVPRCPACGAWLRQHVLWFDEFYDEHADYQWRRVVDAAERVDLLLFVGTSFSVGVTDLFLRGGLMSGGTMLSIDPHAAGAPHPHVQLLGSAAETLLPETLQRVGAT